MNRSGLTVAMLFSTLICACAGDRALQQEQVLQRIGQQKQWLESLRKGASYETATHPVVAHIKYAFSYQGSEKNYKYVQGRYPVTETLFGLFFENGALVSLLLDQAVTDFGVCRTRYEENGRTWPLDEFKDFALLVEQKNSIGEPYVSANAQDILADYTPESGSVNETVEIITHLPLVLIALPFYGIYKLAGGLDPEQLRARAAQLSMGSTTDVELMERLGPPSTRQITERSEIWRYPSPEIEFGIVDHVVYWSESMHSRVLVNDSSVVRDTDCEPVR